MSHTEPAAVGGGDLRATQNPQLWGGWGWRAGNLEGPHRQPPGKTLVKTVGSPTSPHPPEMGGGVWRWRSKRKLCGGGGRICKPTLDRWGRTRQGGSLAEGKWVLNTLTTDLKQTRCGKFNLHNSFRSHVLCLCNFTVKSLAVAVFIYVWL